MSWLLTGPSVQLKLGCLCIGVQFINAHAGTWEYLRCGVVPQAPVTLVQSIGDNHSPSIWKQM